MNLKEEISNFKSMVNSYKLTNLMITANNIEFTVIYQVFY